MYCTEQGGYSLTGSEILEILHDDPATKTYLFSFYNSQFQKVSGIFCFYRQYFMNDSKFIF